MAAPTYVTIDTLYGPPIYIQPTNVAGMTWRGADWNTIIIHWVGGGDLSIPASSLMELGGRLCTQRESNELMDRVAKAIWPEAG